MDTFQEEREKFNGELKKVKEEKAKVHSERDRQKIAFKEKEAKIMTKGAKTKAKIQVILFLNQRKKKFFFLLREREVVPHTILIFCVFKGFAIRTTESALCERRISNANP